MPDDFQLFDAPGPAPAAAETRALSVTEVTKAVRGALESQIGNIWVEGEVSNCRKQASGHQYFTLKDERSQLACVWFARPGMWRRDLALQDGMQVQVRGKLTVYEARGQYQLNVQTAQAAGAGLLQAKFEALKRRLQAEGLFAPERKRPLPPFPVTVAIVTSPSSAALRDMLNIFTRRAPWLHLVISPVAVQGSGAGAAIARAIEELNDWENNGLPRADVIIVGRGGGSAEDLWEFNEEVLGRAVAASGIPTVSAVGHEIDFTICDFAADVRAPTPSAAAELVAPDAIELARRFSQWQARMDRELKAWVRRSTERLAALAGGALIRAPRTRLDAAAQELDWKTDALQRGIRERLRMLVQGLADASAVVARHRPDQRLALSRQTHEALQRRLREALARQLERCQAQFERGRDHLRLLSPEATLHRGYTITRLADGTVLRTRRQAPDGAILKTRVADGEVTSRVSGS